MKKQPVYDLICIGNYTKDTIVTPEGTSYVDGGAVNYSAHAAARLGWKVVVVTHLAREDARVVEKFIASEIDCLATYTPHSTNMRLEYPSSDPDRRTLSVTATAGTIEAEEVERLNARSAVIGPSLRGEVGLDVIQTLKAHGTQVAVDLQGYVRVLRGNSLEYSPWDEMAAYLSLVDVVKSDAVEAEYLTGEKDLFQAARIFSSYGPQEIVLTHKDGLLVYASGQFFDRTFYPRSLNGRSGRGDTCIGTYLAQRLAQTPEEASIWAAAVTSLKMETQGPFNRSLVDVQQLISERYSA